MGIKITAVAIPVAHRDHRAPVQKRICHRHRLAKQAARIVAQIQDNALELGAQLGTHLIHGAFQHDF